MAKQNDELTVTMNNALEAHRNNKHGEAMLLYQRALELDPNVAHAHNNLGAIYQLLERFQDALAHFKRAYEIEPDNVDYKRGYGMGLYSVGDKAKAEEILSECLKVRSDDLIAVDYLSRIYTESARMRLVLDLLQPYYPDNWKQIEFLYYYAMALVNLQEHDQALDLVRAMQEKHGDDVAYLRLLGAILLHMGKYEESIPIMRRTTELEPNEVGNWSNLCAACKGAYLFDEGIKAGMHALSLNPENFDGLSNLGTIHREKGDHEISMEYYRRAMEIRPTHANVHYNYGLSLIAGGYLREGWWETEWRWQTEMNRHIKRPLRKPQWRGQDIGKARLFIYSDQGVGDTIQMARFFPQVRARCPEAKIILRCEDKLIPLLKAHYSDIIDDFIPSTNMLLGDAHDMYFDYHHPMVGLLALLNVDVDQIPDQQYLTAAEPKQYKDHPGQKVIGLSWYTRSTTTGYKRSLALEEFAFLGKLGDVKIINLQYGDTQAERDKAAENGFHVFNDESVDAWADLQPFIDQVAGCDLVISIDNTTVHVAGALGIPVWTLMPFIPYWRWTLNEERSPWYASMRFFKQTAPGRYDDVLGRIERDVNQWMGGDETVLISGDPYTPLVPPYSQRMTKPVATVLNAPSPLMPLERQISGLGLIARLKSEGYDVLEITGAEIDKLPIVPPSLIEFDQETYACTWDMFDPSLVDKILRADKVIVNGETAIAGTSPLTMKLLYLAYYARKWADKRVSIVNHGCFPEGGMELSDPNIVAYYRKVYLACDEVAVTDPLSQSLLEALQIPVTLTAPDLLPPGDAAPKKTKPQVCVLLNGFTALKQGELLAQIAGVMAGQGLSLTLPYYHRDVEGYHVSHQIAALVRGVPVTPVRLDSVEHFYGHLAECEAIITNQMSVVVAAQSLSKKLLVIPGTQPDVEGYCHAHDIELADVDKFMNIKELIPSSPPTAA